MGDEAGKPAVNRHTRGERAEVPSSTAPVAPSMYDIDDLDNRDPRQIARLAGWIDRLAAPYHRAEVRGTDRVPDGAALYVGNHNGGAYSIDTFLFGAAMYRARGMAAVPYGLGHEVAISLPGLNELLVPLGAVRASHENALRLFDGGHKVLVYPGGDFDSTRPFRHRHRVVFGGRRGYVRLALAAGVPIVPVVAAGAQSTFVVVDDGRWLARLLRADRLFRTKTWPITLCLPWGVSVLPLFPYIPLPSRIRIEVLEPIHFRRTGNEAASDEDWIRECASRVETEMQTALTRLSRGLA